jgi:CBS domain-containing protein
VITVREILKAKGHDVWTVTPDASVFDALKLMADKNVGALVVLEEGRLVGIVSERDYARKLVLKEKFSKDTLVREIMTSRVIYVRPEQPLKNVWR